MYEFDKHGFTICWRSERRGWNGRFFVRICVWDKFWSGNCRDDTVLFFRLLCDLFYPDIIADS